ncbi:MAG: winged helix DNA-binding protein [Candidatus Hodarchaeales archaeon]
MSGSTCYVLKNNDLTEKEINSCLNSLKERNLTAIPVERELISDKNGTVMGEEINPEDIFVCLSDTSVLELNHVFHQTNHKILSIELPGDHSFFSEIKLADLEWAGEKLASKEFDLDSRSRIWINRKNVALNDVVISPNKSGVRMRYDVRVDGESIFDDPDLANQFIISTPTGSTSLSLNLGGSIIHPSANVFQLISVASRDYGKPAEIICDKSIITVEIIDSEFPPIYTYDNVRFIPIKKNSENKQQITVEKSPVNSNFIRFAKRDKPARKKLIEKRKFEDVRSLTTTAKFILHVLEQNNKMTVQDIMRETNITNRKTISNAMKLLIEKDFIKKRGSLSDARRQVFSLKK